ncbi:ribonuclease P protein component [Dactylosporangium sp. NPDC050588]|uniref:ribonuclease P protein component n=1 Tax=Dactylosporangium sp. NPDC050588 TaxID=3157211 RepID=UPI0033C0376C
MLAAAQRLRRREDFAATIRNGRRAGRGALVVHFLQSTVEPAPADQPSARAGFVVSDAVLDGSGGTVQPARAGFVVSKAVGNAVVRNLVKRRLRHLVRPHLADLPPAAMVVVRALPPSATASYEDLGRDLEAALAAARRPRSREGRR